VASAVRIGLVLHPRRDCSAAVGQVAAWTTTHGVELLASTEDVARLSVDGVTAVPAAELATGVDGLIALGGDGTLLGAMRLVAAHPVPVLGVNLGRLGFLAEVEGRELDAALEAMAAGRASTETRSCLVVRHAQTESLAFNDAVLARVPGAGLVEATLAVAGQPYGHYKCDALILATPMGSTAYSYAAGGPVVSPAAAGVLVTPSAPLNGIARSLLLGPTEPLTLELTAGSPALELDGVLSGRLDPGAVVEVSLRPDAGLLVRIEGSRAAARSRVKLSLLDLPVLPQELVELLPAALRARLLDDDDPGPATAGPTGP
jgi:NAD+ kinase